MGSTLGALYLDFVMDSPITATVPKATKPKAIFSAEKKLFRLLAISFEEDTDLIEVLIVSYRCLISSFEA